MNVFPTNFVIPKGDGAVDAEMRRGEFVVIEAATTQKQKNQCKHDEQPDESGRGVPSVIESGIGGNPKKHDKQSKEETECLPKRLSIDARRQLFALERSDCFGRADRAPMPEQFVPSFQEDGEGEFFIISTDDAGEPHASSILQRGDAAYILPSDASRCSEEQAENVDLLFIERYDGEDVIKTYPENK